MTSDERSLAEGILYTDQYQLTMAQLYFRHGLHERPALFDHFYRTNPDYGAHQAGFCINAGLEWLLDWMDEARFTEDDLEYLRAQRDSHGARSFGDDFLAWLQKYGNFDGIHLCAIPEGRVVHPNVPLTIVEGPMAMAQILETSLLNHLNYQTLIATKAARISHAVMHGLSGGGATAPDRESGHVPVVMEFGLRRAQERGGNAAARAALIGGADYSSNVGISYVLGLPPRGTHAHSMVQLFMALGGDELDAFRAFAESYPDNCLLLVDTINTLESGVPNAIRVFEELVRKGHKPVGIRLDSGDLAYLAIQAAKMLNDAGFAETSIVLSSDLDELVIWQILTQILEEAPRSGVDAEQLIARLVYGVGTRLVTSWGQPALGGVYKFVAVSDRGEWRPAVKISESSEKTPNPGYKKAWRLYDRRGMATADLLTLDDEDPRDLPTLTVHHPSDASKFRVLKANDLSEVELLHVEVLRAGKRVDGREPINEMRARRMRDIARLDPGVKRLVNPHIYHVSLTENLWNMKQELIRQALAGTR
jgi:nicotinate phosphoribosyltransferase